MRLLLPLLLAGCAAQVPAPDTHEAPVDTDAEADPGEIPLENGPLPPAPIDLAAPAHVELATFALG